MIDHVAKETSKLSLIGLNDIQRKYSMKQKNRIKQKTGPPTEANDPVLNHFKLND